MHFYLYLDIIWEILFILKPKKSVRGLNGKKKKT
jgi:hypothetical protein